MERKLLLAKIFGVTGLVLIWFPVLLNILTTSTRFFRIGNHQFNYFLIAVLFPFALVGMVLLFVASLLSKTKSILIGSLLGLLVFLLLALTIFSKISGVSYSEFGSMDWAWMIVIAVLAACFVCYLLLGIFGAVLVRNLFKLKKAM